MVDTVSILKKDGIGVFPTDTLYGVIGSALSKKAVKRIYEVKGRDSNKPFIILISSLKDLKFFSVELSKEHKEYLDRVWPGRVSVILPVPGKKFEYLHRGTKSLAFRMPNSLRTRELIKKVGPLVAPSANPQGKKPASLIASAKKYFKDSVDFYIGAGKKDGKPSRIVSLLSKEPLIIRR